MNRRSPIVFALLLIGTQGFAQLTDRIYAINNASPSVFWFSYVDIASGTVTDLQLLPITSYGTGSSSCLDPLNDRYYFSTGATLYGLDANGVLPMTTTALPLPPNGLLLHMVYDPCDGMFYGVLNCYGDSVNISRYDPFANTITTVLPLPEPQYLPSNVTAEYDPANGVYFMLLDVAGTPAYDMLCLDVNTGEVLSADSVIQVQGEAFAHWALACSDGTTGPRLFGTSIDGNEQEKYLATCDPFEAQVYHVSPSGTPSGFWKPLGGGSCIDQNEGMFYWSAAGGQIMGASMSDGAFVYDEITGAGQLLCLEHFSTCACVTTAVNENDVAPSAATLLYMDHQLFLNGTTGMQVDVFDSRGSLVRHFITRGEQCALPLEDLPGGCYVARVFSASDQRSVFSTRFAIAP